MKRIKQSYYFTALLYSLTLSLSLNAQVTIGLGEDPLAGSLLQLKEIPDITDGSVNSNRGLLLPRVNLTDMHNLFPMFTSDGANGYTGASKADEDLAHAGLVVYSTNQCLSSTISRNGSGNDNGVYIWNGTSWNSLMSRQSPKVISYTDQDGNTFLAREFKEAGMWMLENLRVKKYDPVRDDPSENPSNGQFSGPNYNTLTGVAGLTAEFWAYPAMAGNTNPANSALYDANPSLGLLYTWAAATHGGNDVPTKQQVQGICPNGWHLPTLSEWTQLIDVIYADYQSYSTGMNPNNNHNVVIGKPMKNACEPFLPAQEQNTRGTSFAKEMGGFDIRLAGFINGSSGTAIGYQSGATSSTYFWTPIKSTTITTNSELLQFKGNTAQAIPAQTTRSDLLSVRCKKNE